jgi:hypothetical protein
MNMTVLPPIVATARFDYFDIVAVCWLIIGLLLGRKRGMSQELLPLVQWIGIVWTAGLLYLPFGIFIHHHTFFSILWSNVTAYVLTAAGVHLIYFWLRHVFAAKLGEKNFFGRAESYLGMTAGAARFGCMILAVMALMNARVITGDELTKTGKSPKEKVAKAGFPTYDGLRQEVLFKSYAGNWVRSNLKSVVIAPVVPTPPVQLETNAPKTSNMIAVVPVPTVKK